MILLEDESEEPAAEGAVTVVVLHHGEPVEIPPQIRSAYTD